MTVRRPSGSALVLVVLVAVVLATVAGPTAGLAVTTGTSLATGIACLLHAGRRRGRIRVTWVAVGAAVLCCAAGYGTASGGVPGPAWFGLVSAVAAGLVALPMGQPSRAGVVRAVLDTLLIGVALLTLGWNFVALPALAAGLPITHPIADVVLATVALSALARYHRASPGSRILLLTSSGLLLLALADSGAVRLLATGATRLAPVATAASFAGLALILLAVLEASAAGAPPPIGDRPDPARQRAILLPYAVVVFALVANVAWMAAGGRPTPVGTWSRLLLILLIVLRQLLLLLENRGLIRRLEQRVAARTADLEASGQRFRALVEQSTDSMAIFEADSTVRYQSESIAQIFGYPASVLVGKRFVDVAPPGIAARVTRAIDEVLAEPGATSVFEIAIPHADGRLRCAEMTITNLMDDPHVRGLVFNTRDISDAVELQEQLRHEAYHDALTGLANRTLFRERLSAAVAGGDAVSVLLLDLDGFKEVNDSLGHAAGDQLLAQVAARLLRATPDGCTVARLGGDEFAVVVGGDDGEAVAARLLAALAEPFRVDGRELHVGAAIGIASAADAADIEQLQRNADLAMYQAKAAGGGRSASYRPEMHGALVRRLELAAELRGALANDELVLHYQPTVDLRTGEITGFEALVRWQHPARGMVSPLEFVGVAEATGLIVPLGRWVLGEACRQAVAWGGSLRIAVNVSVCQLTEDDLAGTVAEVLATTGLPADRLVLEMTESVLLTDTDENLARLSRLKSLGVLLAIDDFGTGFSSLAYLRRFPLDVLKVDRSFVDRLGGDGADEALVRTIVRLGQRFGMVTVAEGIENRVQLDILREMGCDHAQGFLLSRPLPAAEATAILSTGLAAAGFAGHRFVPG